MDSVEQESAQDTDQSDAPETPQPAPDAPLPEWRAWTLGSLGGKGVDCACCGQLVKLYRVPFESVMGVALAALMGLSGDAREWVHCLALPKRTVHKFSQLAYWGLIDERTNESTRKRTSGYWRPTDRGEQFVRGALAVPSHVFRYNQQTYGFAETTVTIHEVFACQFDYASIMAASGTPDFSPFYDAPGRKRLRCAPVFVPARSAPVDDRTLLPLLRDLDVPAAFLLDHHDAIEAIFQTT